MTFEVESSEGSTSVSTAMSPRIPAQDTEGVLALLGAGGTGEGSRRKKSFVGVWKGKQGSEVGGGQSSQDSGCQGKVTSRWGWVGRLRGSEQPGRFGERPIALSWLELKVPERKCCPEAWGLNLKAPGARAEADGLTLQAVLSHRKVFSKGKKMGLTRLGVMKISSSQVAARLTRVVVCGHIL